jgi:hypothetical protein
MMPGDLLSWSIREITGAVPCAACNDCKQEMNEMGWWWCWRNRQKIAHRLVQEAAKLGYEIDRETTLALFVAAFRIFFQHRKQTGIRGMEEDYIVIVQIKMKATSVKDAIARSDEGKVTSMSATNMTQQLPPPGRQQREHTHGNT